MRCPDTGHPRLGGLRVLRVVGPNVDEGEDVTVLRRSAARRQSSETLVVRTATAPVLSSAHALGQRCRTTPSVPLRTLR